MFIGGGGGTLEAVAGGYSLRTVVGDEGGFIEGDGTLVSWGVTGACLFVGMCPLAFSGCDISRIAASAPPCLSMKSKMNCLVSWLFSCFSETPAFKRRILFSLYRNIMINWCYRGKEAEES